MKVRMYEAFYNDETEMFPGDSDYRGDYKKNSVEKADCLVKLKNKERQTIMNTKKHMDEIQEGVFGYEENDYRGYSAIADCEKIDDGKYHLTFKDGKYYDATVYTLNDVCDFIVDDGEEGKKLLIKFIEEALTDDELRDYVAEFYGDENVEVDDAMNDVEFRGYIFDIVYNCVDFVYIMHEFVKSMCPIWKEYDIDTFIFENGYYWFCLV